jgi:hypothetical protein
MGSGNPTPMVGTIGFIKRPYQIGEPSQDGDVPIKRTSSLSSHTSSNRSQPSNGSSSGSDRGPQNGDKIRRDNRKNYYISPIQSPNTSPCTSPQASPRKPEDTPFSSTNGSDSTCSTAQSLSSSTASDMSPFPFQLPLEVSSSQQLQLTASSQPNLEAQKPTYMAIPYPHTVHDLVEPMTMTEEQTSAMIKEAKEAGVIKSTSFQGVLPIVTPSINMDDKAKWLEYTLGEFSEPRYPGTTSTLQGYLYCHLPNNIDENLVKETDPKVMAKLKSLFGETNKILKKIAKHKITHFSARILPEAGPDMLEFSSFLYNLLFFGDDESDGKTEQSEIHNDPTKMRRLCDRILHFLSNGLSDPTMVPEIPLEKAYVEAHNLLVNISEKTGMSFQPILNAFSEYFDGNVEEVNWRKAYYTNYKQIPRLADYENWRLRLSGVRVAQMISCLASRIDPEKLIQKEKSVIEGFSYERARNLLDDLDKSARLISAYGNDLVSFPKEWKDQALENYIMLYYKHHPKATLAEAHNVLERIVNENMQSIEQYASELREILSSIKTDLTTLLDDPSKSNLYHQAREELQLILNTENYLKIAIEDFAAGCTYWPLRDTERYLKKPVLATQETLHSQPLEAPTR